MTELQKLKTELNQILAKIDELERSSRWKPEVNEGYYFIFSDGRVGCEFWKNTDTDYKHYAQGNCFPTGELAEFEVERLKVLAEMREFAFEPNWDDTDETKYYILISFDEISIDTVYAKNIGAIVFESQEQAQACIDAIGKERLKKYYFRSFTSVYKDIMQK